MTQPASFSRAVAGEFLRRRRIDARAAAAPVRQALHQHIVLDRADKPVRRADRRVLRMARGALLRRFSRAGAVDHGESVDCGLNSVQPLQDGVQQIDGRRLFPGEKLGALAGGEGEKVGHVAFCLGNSRLRRRAIGFKPCSRDRRPPVGIHVVAYEPAGGRRSRLSFRLRAPASFSPVSPVISCCSAAFLTGSQPRGLLVSRPPSSASRQEDFA
ncbi:MAG: hypothetical protein V9G24_10975 [Rhodoblastus sp.]